MSDDRWHLKGKDQVVFERFRQIKRDYDEQRDERVTDERALELLMDDVPVERDGDTEAILERLNGLDEDVAEQVVETIKAEHGTY